MNFSGLLRLFPKLSKKHIPKQLFKIDDKINHRWIIKVSELDLGSDFLHISAFFEDQESFMESQLLIRNDFKGLIGSGAYGQIYFAVDETSVESLGVAIKTETKIRKGKTSKRMILEQKVLLRLQGRSHVPLMWGSGSTSEINYIIMQLLSRNLSDIRKQSPQRRFSRSTTGRILIQVIQIQMSGYGFFIFATFLNVLPIDCIIAVYRV
ncbi:unnamed protein product [Anisakis simplex]|uniref:Pkinase_Tyr domain-containing protein n=1 Tax=Anisakis simplex TaxID=6269 RepID=A0A0M3J3W9_ANISI|nr:unnamed protein product [Anisakis simplex]